MNNRYVEVLGPIMTKFIGPDAADGDLFDKELTAAMQKMSDDDVANGLRPDRFYDVLFEEKKGLMLVMLDVKKTYAQKHNIDISGLPDFRIILHPDLVLGKEDMSKYTPKYNVEMLDELLTAYTRPSEISVLDTLLLLTFRNESSGVTKVILRTVVVISAMVAFINRIYTDVRDRETRVLGVASITHTWDVFLDTIKEDLSEEEYKRLKRFFTNFLVDTHPLLSALIASDMQQQLEEIV